MRVRVEDAQPHRELRWRGVALDEFTGAGWRKSNQARQLTQVDERGGLFQFGTTEDIRRLTTQTFFLEPLESPVLFAAPRVVAVQGDLPFVRADGEGSVQSRRHDFERIMYKALSDTNEPRMDLLRNDVRPLPVSYYRYLQLPDDLDHRISQLAISIILHANASTRYDAAKAIEAHLQREYGYSLEMKASGRDPVADFLFNVKAGHCEYFSTAMAVMLRTRGIAARVVNGFLPGEYNEAAGAYTVRQSDAHSWVEVYFPETRSWVTFDPTPSAGRVEPVRTGLTAQLQKYAEALELVWFQYVVGYDKQEQRSLATSLHNQVFDYGRTVSNMLATIRSYFTSDLLSILVVVTGLGIMVALVFCGRKIWLLMRGGFRNSSEDEKTYSSVQFYERLISLMEQRGLARDKHLTPLEFASSLKSSDAILITRAYNRVRYGGQRLSATEKKEVERALFALEATDEHR
jgi:transglutaminase-like putative cysteine protease